MLSFWIIIGAALLLFALNVLIVRYRYRKDQRLKWLTYNSHLPYINELFIRSNKIETRLEKARREERERLNIINSPLPLPEIQEKDFINMRNEDRRSPTELGLYD